MGCVCVYCGKKRKLQFHHTSPRRWTANRVNRLHRMKLYRKDWENGELVLACPTCNKAQGTPTDPDEVPF
jgi:5-methylcytosine-specific restriction endonuclease McrA